MTITSGAALNVRLPGPPETFHDTIQAAYDAMADGGTLQARDFVFNEDLIFNRPINITFSGGFAENFPSPASGMTNVRGSLTFAGGTVIISEVTIY